MSLQVNQSAIAGNDLLFHIEILYNGQPLNLTGYTPLAVLKASPTATDGSGVTYLIGSGLTYVYQQFGRFDWAIPHAAVLTPATMWYRVDIDNGSVVTTALYGTLTLTAA